MQKERKKKKSKIFILMAKKKKFQVEYLLKSSPYILYNFLTSPSALAQWFAENVDTEYDVYKFVWNGSVERAKVIEKVENELIRYQWENGPEDEYFEFSVKRDEITGDTALYITDFALDDEIEDQKLLWDSQVKVLMERIGG